MLRTAAKNGIDQISEDGHVFGSAVRLACDQHLPHARSALSVVRSRSAIRPTHRQPSRLSRRPISAVVAGLIFAATACGGGDPDSDSATATRRRATDAREGAAQEHNGTETTRAVPEPEAGASTTDTTANPSVGGRSVAGTTATTEQEDTFVPGTGAYRYAVDGWTETRTATDNTREEHHGEQVDDVTVQPGAPTKVTILTNTDGDKTQEVRHHVDVDAAHLVQLTTWTPGQASPALVITPNPPIPVAKLPYTMGERWEFAWRDDKVGVQGAGTGTTLRTEQLDTAQGPVDVVVIEIRQRLSGTVTSDLTTTSWVERRTGVQWQQRVISENQNATGGSRTETTRTLVGWPT